MSRPAAPKAHAPKRCCAEGSPASEANAQDALRDRLAALREQGAWRADPTRFRYLEALSQRSATQAPAVRSLLLAKLDTALAEYAQRLPASTPTATQRPRAKAAAALRPVCAPLAQLNEYIRGAAAARAQAAPGEPLEADELASAQRFRVALARRHAQDQVELAAARQPANPGPLNSQRLVLEALSLMQELSPEYLRRFLVHVESLQWLERVVERYPAVQGKKAAAGKQAARPSRKRAK